MPVPLPTASCQTNREIGQFRRRPYQVPTCPGGFPCEPPTLVTTEQTLLSEQPIELLLVKKIELLRKTLLHSVNLNRYMH